MLVAHVITGLNVGGAELMLCQLLSHTNRSEIQAKVISLLPADLVAERIRKLGIPVETIGMARGIPNPLSVVRLAKKLRRTKPSLVQTWMYHADLMGGVASWLVGNWPVVWGLHNTYLTRGSTKATTIFTARLCSKLS